jgi:DNA repair exonuclease SbcCD ATPase subunit
VRDQGQWSERKRLRAGEIASIQEAIGILRSDDARDTFSRSFASQGFLQLSATKPDRRLAGALAVLKQVTRSAKDERIGALATTVLMLKEEPEAEINEADPFKEVISAIDKLIADLEAEEKDDLEKKEQCEKERSESAQNAKMTAKRIDTNTETIDRLTAQIERAQKQIQEINATIYDLEIDKRDAADQREQEHREWVNADADDSKAAELVDSAIGVLKKFREKEGLDLVQVRRARQEPFTAAGEAPPPPPSMPEGSYGGAKGEHQGIVAIMEMVRDDILKDQKKAKDEEDESEARHQTFIEDTDASIKSHQETMATLEGEVAADESSRTDEETTKASNQEELDSTLAFLKDIAAGCDFIAVNFDTRLKNRQAETDGLLKAKSILNGAEGF